MSPLARRLERYGRGDNQARFHSIPPHADRADAALRPDHPALRLRRTIFPSTVVDAEASERLLVSGINSPKLGRAVRKGAWAGMPIYHLTLEERATCPPCHLARECYGNAMHLARRHRHGPEMEQLLGAELQALHEVHERRHGGLVVRLHTLGDFYSLRYVARWAVWMRALPGLRVFGFTSHPRGSRIGALLERLNKRHPDRWVIRFSVPAPTGKPREATTIWRHPEEAVVPEGIVCPAQRKAAGSCGECGLCWAEAAADRTIVFIGHGRKTRKARP